MNPHDELGTHTGERRRNRRRASQGHVRLTLEAPAIDGQIENLSQSGLLFFSEGDVRIRVEIDENGTKRQRTGRLVRSQRMRGESFGWAVEFDPT